MVSLQRGDKMKKTLIAILFMFLMAGVAKGATTTNVNFILAWNTNTFQITKQINGNTEYITNWIESINSLHPSNLTDLADVDSIATPNDGQVLTFLADAGQDKWTNQYPRYLNATPVKGNPTEEGMALIYDNDQGWWTNRFIPYPMTNLGDAADATFSGLAEGHIIAWDATDSIWTNLFLDFLDGGVQLDFSTSGNWVDGDMLIYDGNASVVTNLNFTNAWWEATNTVAGVLCYATATALSVPSGTTLIITNLNTTAIHADITATHSNMFLPSGWYKPHVATSFESGTVNPIVNIHLFTNGVDTGIGLSRKISTASDQGSAAGMRRINIDSGVSVDWRIFHERPGTVVFTFEHLSLDMDRKGPQLQ